MNIHRLLRDPRLSNDKQSRFIDVLRDYAVRSEVYFVGKCSASFSISTVYVIYLSQRKYAVRLMLIVPPLFLSTSTIHRMTRDKENNIFMLTNFHSCLVVIAVFFVFYLFFNRNCWPSYIILFSPSSCFP